MRVGRRLLSADQVFEELVSQRLAKVGHFFFNKALVT